MIIRSQVEQMLQNNICLVTFTKTDGSVRQMTCTLRADIIPPTKGKSVPSDKVIAVWALDRTAWRSFRLDSVIRVVALEQ
jgi:hypothetical protein